MAKTTAVGVEPFDRLEEKVKLLVSTIGRLKGEQSRLADENTRLQRELAALQERVQQAEHAGSEVSALREERDLIRTRVGDMLAELDALNL
ncbi:MAG: cell division protein ZapB [Vicinamibacterales bacterium]